MKKVAALPLIIAMAMLFKIGLSIAGDEPTVECQKTLVPTETLTPSTRAYVNLIRELVLERNRLPLAVLERLASSERPPVEAEIDAALVDVLPADKLAFGRALRKLLGDKNFDWPSARREIQEILRVYLERSGARVEANEATRSLLTTLRRHEVAVPELDQRPTNTVSGWKPVWSGADNPYTVYLSEEMPMQRQRYIVNRVTRKAVRIDPIADVSKWTADLEFVRTPDGKTLAAYPKDDTLHVCDADTGLTLHTVSLVDHKPWQQTEFIPYLGSSGELRVISMRDGFSVSLTDYDMTTGDIREIPLPQDRRYFLGSAPFGVKGMFVIGVRNQLNHIQYAADVNVFSIENGIARPLFDEPFPLGIETNFSKWQFRAQFLQTKAGELYLTLGTDSNVTVLVNLTKKTPILLPFEDRVAGLERPFAFEDAFGKLKIVVGVKEAWLRPQYLTVFEWDSTLGELKSVSIPVPEVLEKYLKSARGVPLPNGGAILIMPWWVFDLSTGTAEHLPIDEQAVPAQSSFLGAHTINGRVEGLWARYPLEGEVLPMQLYGPADDGGNR